MGVDLTRFSVSAGEERGEVLSYLDCDRPGCFWELYVGGSSLAEMVAAAQEHEQEAHPSAPHEFDPPNELKCSICGEGWDAPRHQTAAGR